MIWFDIFSVVWIVFWLWFLRCNSLTQRQKDILRRFIFNGDGVTWTRHFPFYEAVGYTKHHFYLMAFRDPLPLYGAEIDAGVRDLIYPKRKKT